jgi:hypothetical protein
MLRRETLYFFKNELSTHMDPSTPGLDKALLNIDCDSNFLNAIIKQLMDYHTFSLSNIEKAINSKVMTMKMKKLHINHHNITKHKTKPNTPLNNNPVKYPFTWFSL